MTLQTIITTVVEAGLYGIVIFIAISIALVMIGQPSLFELFGKLVTKFKEDNNVE